MAVIIDKLVNKLKDAAYDEIKFQLGINDEVEEITNRLKAFQGLVEYTGKRKQDTSLTEERVLKQLRETAIYIEDVLEKFMLEMELLEINKPSNFCEVKNIGALMLYHIKKAYWQFQFHRQLNGIKRNLSRDAMAYLMQAAAENNESSAKRSKSDEDNANDKAAKLKAEQNGSANTSGDGNNKENKDHQKASEPPKDYIHVRARRGQATVAYSLAERLRREKISQRMKLLQDLVPGCNKITGKVVMLDEIINYVQSLQRQVEFLSMKLHTINPRMDVNIEALLSKDMFESRGSLPHGAYASDTSASALPFSFQLQQVPNLHSSIPDGTKVPLSMNHMNAAMDRNSSLQIQPADSFNESAAQASTFWKDDLLMERFGISDDYLEMPDITFKVAQLQILSGVHLNLNQAMELKSTTQLTKLNISATGEESWREIYDAIRMMRNLRTLKLKAGIGRPEVLQVANLPVPPCLEKLTLFLFNRLPNGIVSHGCLREITLYNGELFEDGFITLGQLPSLKVLKLDSCYQEEQLICEPDSFPELEEFEISSPHYLTTWNQIPKGSMKCLRKLTINFCRRLQMLPDGLQELQNLQMLNLLYMPKEFLQRIDIGGPDYSKIQRIPRIQQTTVLVWP